MFRNDHDILREKLQNLEKKILVGGENLLEKAEVQEQLLEASARELEQRRRKEEQLRQALQQKEVRDTGHSIGTQYWYTVLVHHLQAETMNPPNG
jgi:hypothetical protein